MRCRRPACASSKFGVLMGEMDIDRGYLLVEEDASAAAIEIPANAVTVGNWHLHGARGWQGLAATPNGAPQCEAI